MEPSPLTSGPASPVGGPKFELEERKGGLKKFRAWISRWGGSVIMPIIALIILAGGIYLYATQRSENIALTLQERQQTEQQQENNTDDQGQIAGQEQQSGNDNQQQAQGDALTETAQRGDGVTHLARRALASYLKDSPRELTNEHKIYIEDFLKDRTGSRPLEIGEQISFSEDLLNEAISASLELSPNQLQNLEQFSVQVNW